MTLKRVPIFLKNTRFFKLVDLNKNKKIDLDKLKYRSAIKIFWVCDKKHSFANSPHHVTRGVGCPYCAKGTTKITNEKSLEFLKPDIAKRWHPTKNTKSPKEVLSGTVTKYWFVCEKKHAFKSTPSNMTLNSCPYCSGKKICSDNNIKYLFPDIAKEWNYKKNSSSPENYTKGSNVKVWWLCKLNHTYKSTIKSRCINGSGCPKCFSNISKVQMRIYSELKYFFKSVQLGAKINKNEIDVYIENFKIAIEYDGSYYHLNRIEKDLDKNKKIKKLGIKLIRIREEPLKKLSENDILIKKNIILNKENMNTILRKVVEIAKISPEIKNKIYNYYKINNYINDQYYNELINDLPFPQKKFSFYHNFPELMDEWNYKKNKNIDPKSLYRSSRGKFWWICSYGHEWFANLRDRTYKKAKCRICSFEKRDERWMKMNKARKGKKKLDFSVIKL